MKTGTVVLSLITVFAVGALTASAFQETKKTTPAAHGDDMGGFPMAKPTTEHQWIKTAFEGTWDAKIEGMGPASTGAETCKVVHNGFWLSSTFTGTFMGMPFSGEGVLGYDPTKKKYVGTWVDSMSPSLGVSEGSYDAKTNTLTQWMEGTDHTGNVVKSRMTHEWKGADTRVFSMYMPGPDGKEAKAMWITYTRKK